MQAKDLSYVIKENLDPTETILVHGTSIEAVLAFLNTGKMLKSEDSQVDNSQSYSYDGFLFFFPNRAHFEGHPLYGSLDDLDWDEHIISSAEDYAQFTAVRDYIKNQTGFNPEGISPQLLFEFEESEADKILHDLSHNNKEEVIRELYPDWFPPNKFDMHSRLLGDELYLKIIIRSLESNLDHYKTNLSQLKLGVQDMGFSLDQTSQIILDAKKRKGVLLGFGKDIFELNIEEGKDMPEEEVCIYLPGGLDIKYINGIVPLGTTEKNILLDYVGK